MIVGLGRERIYIRRRRKMRLTFRLAVVLSFCAVGSLVAQQPSTPVAPPAPEATSSRFRSGNTPSSRNSSAPRKSSGSPTSRPACWGSSGPTSSQVGLAVSAALRSIRPGKYDGFWESYKGDIAAYKLDRLLELDMVPPTVERRYNGEMVSLQLWGQNMKMLRQVQEKKLRPPTSRPTASSFAGRRCFTISSATSTRTRATFCSTRSGTWSWSIFPAPSPIHGR